MLVIFNWLHRDWLRFLLAILMLDGIHSNMFKKVQRGIIWATAGIVGEAMEVMQEMEEMDGIILEVVAMEVIMDGELMIMDGVIMVGEAMVDVLLVVMEATSLKEIMIMDGETTSKTNPNLSQLS